MTYYDFLLIYQNMDKIKIHFCPSNIELSTKGLNIKVAELKKEREPKAAESIIEKAIEEADIDLESFARESSSILVIVNDRQRPTPTSFILPFLKPIFDKKPEFIVACGAHEPPKDDELKAIFGSLLETINGHLHIHKSKLDKMVKIARSSDGFDFELNEVINRADSLVLVNSVEPHYFAGFTGGRKSFLPGIASYRTICENHKFSLLPTSATFVLENNPIHKNMTELAQHIERMKRIYSLQVVLDGDGKIYSAYAGTLENSFWKAVEDARKLYGVKVESKADIVITVASSPQDARLYQSFKALDNGSIALKDDGILILVASCHDGLGNKEFLENIKRFKSPSDVLNSKEFTVDNYKLGNQRIMRLARWSSNGNLWLVSNMEPDEAKTFFFRPFSNLNDAVEKALSIKGNDAKILVVPNGILTVPFVDENT